MNHNVPRTKWAHVTLDERDAVEREARAKAAARAVLEKQKRKAPVPPVPPREAYPPIAGCESVVKYERLNHIEEGSYGVVSRARNKETGEVVALKQLKLDKEKHGFPITSLREIHALMEARHPHIVQLKELVVGDTLNKVYLVMEFVEHDMKTLLGSMRTPFLQSEIKALMQQILAAVAYMHDRWIVHRDLKTSNLLMTNRGCVKIADFGLARMFGDPQRAMTSLVVTLWYRAPELLLGAEVYDTAVDMWSVGCIFAELLLRVPLFPGKKETDQVSRIFRLLGRPTPERWPGYTALPNAATLGKSAAPSQSSLRHRFRYTTDATLDMLERMLTLNPARRISSEDALKHVYFTESPLPAHPDSFGSFPSAASGEKRRALSPSIPRRDAAQQYPLEFEWKQQNVE
ncbi:cyclin-dependent kinase [Malassezia vespertilionis]|uniref:cyclin-dependent kinase n=1 Tax=Malassezia vespertilionis TaxID=2020962 RepID=A0A2N1J774_9BASI|nr:cyclin-dependent kinase [Malassezia vespertilionis]PKI82399.1 hypothetical protein MVES_003618 [Malassezia vespertilionis]WFD08008.1 cyclin-dependent kinase [Malassezia vespertilionis]